MAVVSFTAAPTLRQLVVDKVVEEDHCSYSPASSNQLPFPAERRDRSFP